MVDCASHYAKHNQGVKYHAVVLPFSALSSYNEAEAQYNGIREMGWVEFGSHMLQDLNFEHIRLQRLRKVLADKAQLKDIADALRQDAKHKVCIHTQQECDASSVNIQACFALMLCVCVPTTVVCMP